MNLLSDIFDIGLQALGIHVATCCNGHTFFVGCVLMAFAAAVYFRRWSWLALAVSVSLGIGGNVLRILALLPLAKLPVFPLVHDLCGWAMSGLVFLVIVEIYEPRRSTALWLGRALCALLFVWGVLFVLAHAFPVSDCRVATPSDVLKTTGD